VCRFLQPKKYMIPTEMDYRHPNPADSFGSLPPQLAQYHQDDPGERSFKHEPRHHTAPHPYRSILKKRVNGDNDALYAPSYWEQQHGDVGALQGSMVQYPSQFVYPSQILHSSPFHTLPMQQSLSALPPALHASYYHDPGSIRPNNLINNQGYAHLPLDRNDYHNMMHASHNPVEANAPGTMKTMGEVDQAAGAGRGYAYGMPQYGPASLKLLCDDSSVQANFRLSYSSHSDLKVVKCSTSK
jgi:hypothetical protein